MSSIFDCFNRRGEKSRCQGYINEGHNNKKKKQKKKNLRVYFLNSKTESKYDVAVNQPNQQKHEENNI